MEMNTQTTMMKQLKRFSLLVLAVTSFLIASSCTNNIPPSSPDKTIGNPFSLPTGWYAAGSKPAHYDMGIDKDVQLNGKNAATIKSNTKKTSGFGTLMQTCSPNKYRGKRIRMSGYIKSENVASWAGLWLRVDEKSSQVPLAFDNMHDRPVKGTTEWKKYEIVLDVPSNAYLLAYGVLMDGAGQVWFANFNFEEVDNSVPTTGNGFAAEKGYSEPTNLSFDK